MMKYLLLLTILGITVTSCDNGENGEEKKDNETTENNSDNDVSNSNKNIALFFGEKFDTTGAVTTSEFPSVISGKDTVELKLKARINQTCKKKGCWMTLNIDDDNEMRVWFKDYGFFVPKNADGFESIITGFAYIDTVSVEMQKHLLEDEKVDGKEIAQADIDAIVEPKVELGFEASGVMIYMPDSVAKESQKQDTIEE